MRPTHGSDAKVLHVTRPFASYHCCMMATDLLDTRPLTLVLSEAEWRALRTVEADPVGWLKLQVRRRLSGESDGREEGRPAANEAPSGSASA